MGHQQRRTRRRRVCVAESIHRRRGYCSAPGRVDARRSRRHSPGAGDDLRVGSREDNRLVVVTDPSNPERRLTVGSCCHNLGPAHAPPVGVTAHRPANRLNVPASSDLLAGRSGSPNGVPPRAMEAGLPARTKRGYTGSLQHPAAAPGRAERPSHRLASCDRFGRGLQVVGKCPGSDGTATPNSPVQHRFHEPMTFQHRFHEPMTQPCDPNRAVEDPTEQPVSQGALRSPPAWATRAEGPCLTPAHRS